MMDAIKQFGMLLNDSIHIIGQQRAFSPVFVINILYSNIA